MRSWELLKRGLKQIHPRPLQYYNSQGGLPSGAKTAPSGIFAAAARLFGAQLVTVHDCTSSLPAEDSSRAAACAGAPHTSTCRRTFSADVAPATREDDQQENLGFVGGKFTVEDFPPDKVHRAYVSQLYAASADGSQILRCSSTYPPGRLAHTCVFYMRVHQCTLLPSVACANSHSGPAQHVLARVQLRGRVAGAEETSRQAWLGMLAHLGFRSRG